MKNLSIIIFLFFILSQKSFSQKDEKKMIEKSKYIATSLSKHFFDSIQNDFDSAMKKELPKETIKNIWISLPQLYGNFLGFDTSVKINTHKNINFSETKTRFKRGNLNMRISFDSTLKISGLFFLPITNESGYEIPAYVDQNKFYETKAEVVTGEYKMHGIFSIPNDGKKFPAILLVSGSGPNGMNEEVGGHRVFQDIAQGLASKNIVVLRYDKRTFSYGYDIDKNGLPTMEDEYYEDIANALKLMKLKPYIDTNNIYIIGHSQGGMILPELLRRFWFVKGGVMMAGPARKLQDLILDQTNYLAGNGKKSAEMKLTLELIQHAVKLSLSDTLKPTTPADMLPALGFPGSYFLDLRKYNQVNVAKNISKPMLILQGERDYQVTMKDYKIWKKNIAKNKNVTMKLYSKLNHLFTEGEGESTPEEYFTAGNVAKYVIDDIAKWVKENLK